MGFLAGISVNQNKKRIHDAEEEGAERAPARATWETREQGGPEKANSNVTPAEATYLVTESGARGMRPDSIDYTNVDWFALTTRNKIVVKDEETPLDTKEYWRQSLFDLLENPSSSTAAYFVAVLILVFIILSSITFCAETVKEVQENALMIRVIQLLDDVFIAVFTFEYVIRLLVAEDRPVFVKTPANIVDLVAIVPYYIEKLVDLSVQLGGSAGGGASFDLRFLRLARVFRIFKLSRYGHRMQLVFDALRESQEILAMLSVNLAILVVVFSSITYYAEKDQQDTTFESIPHTCWWCIVTVLTVGYGDMSPTSLWGKLVATILMLFSLLVMALPITIIGSCFSNSWNAYKDDQRASERAEGLPQKFKSKLLPQLDSFIKDWIDYNQSFREQNQSLRRLNHELKGLLVLKDFPKIQALMPQMQNGRRHLDKHLTESLQWTSNAFENYIQDMHEAQVCSKNELYKGQEMMKDSDSLMKQAMADMVKQRTSFVHNGVDLSDFQAVAVVHVVGGRDLVIRDVNGTSDPYVIIQHGGYETCSTEVCRRSLSPMWDEHKLVMLRNQYEPLHFAVYDRDMLPSLPMFGQGANVCSPTFTRDQYMGKCEVKLIDYEQGVPRSSWLPLEDVDSGMLRVTIVVKDITSITLEELSDPNVWPIMCSTLLGNKIPKQREADVKAKRASNARWDEENSRNQLMSAESKDHEQGTNAEA